MKVDRYKMIYTKIMTMTEELKDEIPYNVRKIIDK